MIYQRTADCHTDVEPARQSKPSTAYRLFCFALPRPNPTNRAQARVTAVTRALRHPLPGANG